MRWVQFLVWLIMGVGCSPSSDYVTVNKHIKYQLLAFEEGIKADAPGYLIWLTKKQHAIPKPTLVLVTPKRDSLLYEVFHQLHYGDSIRYMKLTGQSHSEEDLPHAKLIAGVSSAQIRVINKFPSLLQYPPKVLLQLATQITPFLERQINLKNGVFIVPEVVGSGSPPQKKDEVQITYQITGYSPQGDSVVFNPESLQYVIGNHSQVVKGFELGISELTEGSKALLIIPPHLGWKAPVLLDTYGSEMVLVAHLSLDSITTFVQR